MVIGLRFKCHTLHASPSPVSRDSPLETSGRSPARAYELDTSPPSKGVRNHPARLSSNISQGRPSQPRRQLSLISLARLPASMARSSARAASRSLTAGCCCSPAGSSEADGASRAAAEGGSSACFESHCCHSTGTYAPYVVHRDCHRPPQAEQRAHARDGTPLYRSRLGKPPHGPRLLPLRRACGPWPG